MMRKLSDRPKVTFALFAYNQEKYIREAIEGAFSQTYEQMEIILSDDCSTDRTFQIIQDIAASYRGDHAVRVRQNDRNLGIAQHFNAVLRESTGEIVVLAAGDDVSLPDRTSLSVDFLVAEPRSTAVLLSAHIIDGDGRVTGERLLQPEGKTNGVQTLEDLLARKHITMGASRAMWRDVMTRFGPLNDCCPTEDTPLLLRSLIDGINIISNRKGILYRRHENNLSNVSSLKKMKIDAIHKQYRNDIRTAVALGLISESLENRLQSWIDNDERSRQIDLKLNSDDPLSLRETFFAIRNRPTATLMEKTWILGAFIKRNLLNITDRGR